MATKVATNLGGTAPKADGASAVVTLGDRRGAGHGILELMDDETYTVCPNCGERIDSHEPGAVYAVEQVEITTMGPTHQVINGLGGYFHETCPPEAVGYARRPPPTAPS